MFTANLRAHHPVSLSHDAYKNMHTTHTHLAISTLELGLAAAHRGATSLKAPQIVTLDRLSPCVTSPPHLVSINSAESIWAATSDSGQLSRRAVAPNKLQQRWQWSTGPWKRARSRRDGGLPSGPEMVGNTLLWQAADGRCPSWSPACLEQFCWQRCCIMVAGQGQAVVRAMVQERVEQHRCCWAAAVQGQVVEMVVVPSHVSTYRRVRASPCSICV